MVLYKEEKQLLATILNVFGKHTTEATVYNITASPFTLTDILETLEQAKQQTKVMSFCTEIQMLIDRLTEATN